MSSPALPQPPTQHSLQPGVGPVLGISGPWVQLTLTHTTRMSQLSSSQAPTWLARVLDNGVCCGVPQLVRSRASSPTFVTQCQLSPACIATLVRENIYLGMIYSSEIQSVLLKVGHGGWRVGRRGAGEVAESSISHPAGSRRRDYWAEFEHIQYLKPVPGVPRFLHQGHIYSSKNILPNAATPRGPNIQHMSLWGPYPFKLPHRLSQ